MKRGNHRRCPACGEFKPPEDFYLRKGKPGGYCKSCAKVKALKHKQAFRENVIGIDEARKFRAKHRKHAEMAKRDKSLVGQKTCRSCELVKPVEDFYVIRNKGTDSYCKPCRLEIDKEHNRRSPGGRLNTLIGAARTRARKNDLEFNLTKAFMIHLWEKQNGECYYTRVDLTFDGKRLPSALSIDRVDPKKGYTKDNVVLCCRLVNEVKTNLTVNELLELCQIISENLKGVSHGKTQPVATL